MPLTDNTAQWGVRKLTKFQENSGIPVGFEYFSTNPNIPMGSLPLFGGEYSRTVYADLWSWVQEQAGYLIEESEWQVKFSSNEGNVPFYSKGNGTTTFRVPSLKCWVKGANGIEEVGSYLSAGLPNITGGFNVVNNNNNYGVSNAFTVIGGGHFLTQASKENNFEIGRASFNASRSNSIYGNFDTVQPKSIVGMWLVKAYGTVTNVGSTDVAAIAQGLTRVENKLNEAAIVGTVIPYAGTSLPKGYLPCNGASVSRETYASLFEAIGETYGAGDGSTTFNLPNLTDKFIQGSDTAGTVKSAGLPNITGHAHLSAISSVNAIDWHNFSGVFANSEKNIGSSTSAFVSGGGKGDIIIKFNASNSNAIYGESDTVQPPALTMRYIIKY